ncbi:MAG: haloacid dehalogenase-like hydrolase [Bacteroidales bacterium]|nr:haloacid dehalogenase-like hydrolase [Bacteroidales bacterium]MCB9014134.1 haloacid dehalogenase-like hydrolase [Bacteroidales bacterium]
MRKLIILSSLAFLSFLSALNAQSYRYIKGWAQETNDQIESFLNSTLPMTERKVAVFDCDGTTFGQVPHYLADEALYQYAEEVLKKRNDKDAKERLAILDRMVKDGNNVGKPYVEDRVHFLAGLSPEEIEMIGAECYRKAYQGKFYPEMKELIANLKEYGFEVWILTASPEILYQKFVAEELGIPYTHIVGAKCVIANGKTTGEIIPPIPQDDGKASSIETFIKARPLIVGGNSRGDLDMLNESVGLKIVVNPDDVKVRGPEDGPMEGLTVKSYWENEGALIVKCNDVANPAIDFYTTKWKIRKNIPNPK